MPSADTSLSREIESFMELVVVVGGVDTSTATAAAASDAGSWGDDRLCIVSSVSVGACSGERGAHGLDDIGGALVAQDVGGDPAMCVEDGGVVATTEAATDRRQRLVGQLAREVHRDLSGERDLRAAVVRE